MDQIRTMEEREGIVSLTGGTTGASMKVIYHPEDMQERFALKDYFRSRYGYKLGRKVDRKSGVKGKSVSVRVDRGSIRHITTTTEMRGNLTVPHERLREMQK